MMERKPKQETPPEVTAVDRDGWVRETRTYRVITPLFGGGEETQKADSITTVRASEVRGHLRFWWRAMRGGNSTGDLAEMKQREENIWGSTSGKDSAGKNNAGHSKVSMIIRQPIQNELIKKIKDHKGNLVGIGEPTSPWGYVAFPLRAQDNKPAGSVLSGVFFDLELTYPDEFAAEIETAIWAWEVFGGIGARIRRGFGALQCVKATRNGKDVTESLLESQKVEQEIKDRLNHHVVEGKWPKGVPHISADIDLFVSKNRQSPEEAWEDMFSALRDFRQKNSRYDRKTGRKSSFGLSRWPEANAIRVAFNLPPRFPIDVPEVVVNKYPRGKFGLPIGFEMHHDKEIKTRPELRGIEHDRLASPLILRPIPCKEGAVGLAAVLNWEPMSGDDRYTPPGGLILKDAPENPAVSGKLDPDEIALIPPLAGEKDVLKAFFKYLRKSGGTKR